jgi:hypothetical protein
METSPTIRRETKRIGHDRRERRLEKPCGRSSSLPPASIRMNANHRDNRRTGLLTTHRNADLLFFSTDPNLKDPRNSWSQGFACERAGRNDRAGATFEPGVRCQLG